MNVNVSIFSEPNLTGTASSLVPSISTAQIMMKSVMMKLHKMLRNSGDRTKQIYQRRILGRQIIPRSYIRFQLSQLLFS